MASSARADSAKAMSKSYSTPQGPLSAALEAVAARPRRAQRRPTKQASYELANHAKAYLEIGHYASGYDFLYSLLAAGTSISTPAQPYIGFLAPVAYIALASSLIVWPHITTQTESNDARRGADAALRYLQCVQTTIDGPAYPSIKNAFAFPRDRSRRRGPDARSAPGSVSPELGGDIERIAGDAANAECLWYRADDFWHIVGWAFNCSVAHKKRWDRWKLWLSTMLDFLEADWDFCVKRSRIDGMDPEACLLESLLWQYIPDDGGRAHRDRRRYIVKAILAMATLGSRKDYPEIWKHETAEPKLKKNASQHVGDVNFETGDIADYDSDELMQDASEQNSGDDAQRYVSPPSNDAMETMYDAAEMLGGQDAIELRQRLLALLAQVAAALPTQFTSLSDFFDNVLEDFVGLPTMIFKVLLSTSKMQGLFQVAFNTNLLMELASGKLLPDYFTYEPEQTHLEDTLLSRKGTSQSYAQNAKISLILEQIFLYMMNENALVPTDGLREATEAGIQARNSVHGTGRGKKSSAEEEDQARGLMEASSERLLGLLEVLEMSAGKSPQPLVRKSKATTEAIVLSSPLSTPEATSPLSSAPDSDDSMNV